MSVIAALLGMVGVDYADLLWLRPLVTARLWDRQDNAGGTPRQLLLKARLRALFEPFVLPRGPPIRSPPVNAAFPQLGQPHAVALAGFPILLPTT